MMRLRFLMFAAGLVISGNAACAAASQDWPCVQRKVPEISAAAVWRGPPLGGAALPWRNEPAIAGPVDQLAARRTSEEEARRVIAGLAQSSGGEKQSRLLALFSGLLEKANDERGDVITGLERFGAAQKRFADAIRAENSELSKMRADANADPAQIAGRTEQLNWNLRVFEERQKSLRYVCEVPALIEQHLFMLARAIEEQLKAP